MSSSSRRNERGAGTSRAQGGRVRGDSFYTRLGVEESASPEEIRRAYRTLSLRFHPVGIQQLLMISSAFPHLFCMHIVRLIT